MLRVWWPSTFVSIRLTARQLIVVRVISRQFHVDLITVRVLAPNGRSGVSRPG